MPEYLVQGATLTAIANQARRLTGANAPMSLSQITNALSGVNAGNSFGFPVGNASLGVDDYVNGNKKSALTSISMPACASIPQFEFEGNENLTSAHFPACTSVGDQAFRGCSALETVALNSACAIGGYAFLDVIAPNGKTLRVYLRGNAMGTCDDTAFGVLDKTDSDYDPAFDPYFDTGVIPGLEIYVPASLLDSFKTTWAGGAFANNIFALTD